MGKTFEEDEFEIVPMLICLLEVCFRSVSVSLICFELDEEIFVVESSPTWLLLLLFLFEFSSCNISKKKYNGVK